MAKRSADDPSNLPFSAKENGEELQNAAKNCKSCDLWKHATQTVFGEGSPKSKVMMVGEQPGDQEDRDGKPFVGPAGKLLDTALVEAGVDRKRSTLRMR